MLVASLQHRRASKSAVGLVVAMWKVDANGADTPANSQRLGIVPANPAGCTKAAGLPSACECDVDDKGRQDLANHGGLQSSLARAEVRTRCGLVGRKGTRPRTEERRRVPRHALPIAHMRLPRSPEACRRTPSFHANPQRSREPGGCEGTFPRTRRLRGDVPANPAAQVWEPQRAD